MGYEQDRKSISPEFVGRDLLIRRLSRAIYSTGTDYPPDKRLIYIQAPDGYGKSALLAEVSRSIREGTFSKESRGETRLKRYPSQFILDCSRGLSYVRREVYEKLREEGDGSNNELPDELLFASRFLTYYGPDQSSEREEGYPVLLVDNLDKLSKFELDRLENEILWPAIKDCAGLVIGTAKQRVRLGNIGLRRHLTQVELTGLTQTDTVRQLQGGFYDPRLVYQITAGHPRANQVLNDRLVFRNPVGYPDVFADIINATAREVFFTNIPESSLQKALLDLSCLRVINVESARAYLEMGDTSDGYFLGLFGDLESTGLFGYQTQEHGYMVDPCLRRMIEQANKIGTLEKWQSCHARAADIYLGWLERRPDDPSFFLERIYHLACAGRGKELLFEALAKYYAPLERFEYDPKLSDQLELRLQLLKIPLERYISETSGNSTFPISSGLVRWEIIEALIDAGLDSETLFSMLERFENSFKNME